MKNRGRNIILALVLSVVIVGLFAVGYTMLPNPTAQRIFQLFGGKLPDGIIQLISFFFFFWGLFEIMSKLSDLRQERKSLNMNLLPEKEHWVLSPDDINDLKLKMIDYEDEYKYLLTDMIKKACTKFRSNKSISDVLEIVSTQVKINMNRAEGAQSIVRYLAWALPSVGFIGTILGIASALGLADKASDPEVLGQITSSMYVAFDTTLVALILSVILMWFFHQLQEREDQLHTDMEEYVIENLVNRIHVE